MQKTKKSFGNEECFQKKKNDLVLLFSSLRENDQEILQPFMIWKFVNARSGQSQSRLKTGHGLVLIRHEQTLEHPRLCSL